MSDPIAAYFLEAACTAFADPRTAGIEKLVVIAYDLYGEQSDDETIMRMCGISEPDLREAQMALKQHGLLQKECEYETEGTCEHCGMKSCICQEPEYT